MSKQEKDEVLSELTSMLFSAMLDDIVLDVTLQAHYEVQKLNTICAVCHTRCGSAHASSSSVTAPASMPATPGPRELPSRPATPDTRPTALVSGTGAGTNTPTNGKADGTIYFECLNCKRQIASNRYAPHLSACMGVGAGNRRGASRGTIGKSKSSVEGRSASPFHGSDVGNASDDSKNPSAKGKGKSKNNRKDDAEFNLHRKRPASPQISPKKPKKPKQSSSSPLKNSTETGTAMPPPKSKNLSKSRAPSTTSDLMQDREGSASLSVDNESRLSVFTPEATPMTPTSSTDSPSTSTTLANGVGKSTSVIAKPGNPIPKSTTATSTKAGTPSRPPPPTIHKMPDPNYMLMGYEGEETGSSTDSEND